MVVDTSEESKQHSREGLNSLGGEDAFYGKQGDDAPAAGIGDDNRVLGGHKATLSNPSTAATSRSRWYSANPSDTSEQAKQHSKDVLENANV